MTGHDDAPIWEGLTRHLDALGVAAPRPDVATVVGRRASSRTVGRLELGGLTVAVVVVALVAVVVGPRMTASGAPVAVARDGAFTLELRADRATYGVGEPITGIVATLTYVGPDATVSISHAHLSPLGFGIVEPVNGWHLAPAWRQSCESSILTKGVGLAMPFGKSGASSGDDSAFIRFMEDPVLRLPAGTWHVYVEASFDEGGCAGGRGIHDLKAQITILVSGAGPAPTATPVSPSVAPTAASPMPSDVLATPTPSDTAAATAFVDRYIRALVQSDFAQAWGLLGAESQDAYGSLANFTYDRKAYFQSVAGQYTITANPPDTAPIQDWLRPGIAPALDLSTAVLVEVDYPKLAGNNAGWELYVVAPTTDGLRLWGVR